MKEGFIPEIQLPEQREELPSASQFREFRAALSVVYCTKPEGEAFRLNQPSSLSRQAHELFTSGQKVPPEIARFYYPDVPSPVDLTELSDKKLTDLIQTFGPDIIRAKMVSKSIAENDASILPVGGACLIETFGTETLKGKACEDPEIKAKTAQTLLNNAPYYTQITGTMIMGGKEGIGLMYREEFPWYLRAEEFGVENAQEQTINTYDRIVKAQLRRGALIDPEFSLITLSFNSLDLEKEGLLREWFGLTIPTLPSSLLRSRKPEYMPDSFLQSWVRYTYNGPRILDVVRQRLEGLGISLNGTSMHVRTKQLDHLGGPTDLLKDFDRMDYEDLMKLRKYQRLFGISIDSYLAHDVDNDSIGFVGFDDFAVDGDIVNQTIYIETPSNSSGKRRKQPGNAEELEEAMTSVVRLNSNNLEDHLAFLDFVAIAESEQVLTVKSAIKISSAIQKLNEHLKRITSEKKIAELAEILAEKHAELDDLLTKIPSGLLEKADKISRFPKASILPLSDNLVVSHAIQLSFDPDMREFVCDTAFIVQRDIAEVEKKKILMEKMQEILPKIKQYLTFIMKGGEFPSLRFTNVYAPVRNAMAMV